MINLTLGVFKALLKTHLEQNAPQNATMDEFSRQLTFKRQNVRRNISMTNKKDNSSYILAPKQPLFIRKLKFGLWY